MKQSAVSELDCRIRARPIALPVNIHKKQWLHVCIRGLEKVENTLQILVLSSRYECLDLLDRALSTRITGADAKHPPESG